MAGPTDWLDEGLRLLSDGGLRALRIEALAGRLGLTKGSFYHHFVDLADYRRALLAHYEDLCTTRHIRANAGLQELPTVERLMALGDAVLAEESSHQGLEVAVRTWATQDDDARDTVERIDALRLGYLRALFSERVDPEHADLMARTSYYLLIGAQHAVPPGSTDELVAMWQALVAPLREGAGS